MLNQFNLTLPCGNCPFLNNGKAISLEDGRKEEIITGLLKGLQGSFHCHKTVHRPDGRNFNDDGDYEPVDVSHCPGAAAVSRKFGRDTTMVQIATRLGFIKEDHYDKALSLTIEPEDLKINKRDVHL